MRLWDLLVSSADSGLKLQRDDGSFPGGHNGPWHDSETPVRNTSHWTITFAKAYEITGDEKYLRAVKNAISHLTSEDARPYGETFHHRTNPRKDFSNGLIGQAWTIEALATASKTLDRPDLMRLAEEVFKLHPFNKKIGLWKTVEIDGEANGYDITFNHQLWFAASGGLLEGSEVRNQVVTFLDQLNSNVHIYESGLVHHVLSNQRSLANLLYGLTDKQYSMYLLKTHYNWVRTILPGKTGNDLKEREVGYHSFNMYGFALLREGFPDHPFWDKCKINRMLQYVNSGEYRQKLDDNNYGFPYNPPGFENAYALSVFTEDTDLQQREWVKHQIERTFNFETGFMNLNTSDSKTYAARIYEATRLPNYRLTEVTD